MSLPDEAAYWPVRQALQNEMPEAAPAVPLLQGRHASTDDAPVRGWYLPLSQKVQASAPIEEYLPLWQEAQNCAGLAETFPAAQGRQLAKLEEPVLGKYFPSGHEEHLV